MEEYILAHVYNASGAFIGQIHSECEDILGDISKKCFHNECFKGEQSKRLINHIYETYGVKPEFLWEKLPDWAIMRKPNKKSWFAVIGKISKTKLGYKEDEIIEIMNLKDAPDEVAAHVETGKVYKAYHMNKKHWYTIILDESLTDGEIIEFIRRSFEIVK